MSERYVRIRRCTDLIIRQQFRAEKTLLGTIILVVEESLDGELGDVLNGDERHLRVRHNCQEFVVLANILPIELVEVICELR